MLKRKYIKTLIYQYIVTHEKVIAWFEENELTGSIEDYVGETGQNQPSAEINFPAIRYRIVSDVAQDCDKQRVTFDIYIDSRQDNTKEDDDLMDLMREIFLEKIVS